MHDPLYLQLEPSNAHLAKGILMLLKSNYWHKFTLIVERELLEDGFYNEVHREVEKITNEPIKWEIEKEIILGRKYSSDIYPFKLLSMKDSKSRVVVIHCSELVTKKIFQTVKGSVLHDFEFAWVLTEKAASKKSKVLHDYPAGSLALIMYDVIKMEDIMRDALGILDKAMEGAKLHNSNSVMSHMDCWSEPSAEQVAAGKDLYK